ncbi:MAG: type II toxin-antitoxin system RelE/ParE family toxin [Fimbriimonadaceae bacterium]
MKLYFTEEAENDLRQIWYWTAEKFGVAQADKYRSFLVTHSELVSEDYDALTRPVGDSSHRYAVLKTRPSRGSHGHIVVFELVQDSLYVLNYFHTSSNWNGETD